LPAQEEMKLLFFRTERQVKS